jgi:hypothetical protein
MISNFHARKKRPFSNCGYVGERSTHAWMRTHQARVLLPSRAENRHFLISSICIPESFISEENGHLVMRCVDMST